MAIHKNKLVKPVESKCADVEEKWQKRYDILEEKYHGCKEMLEKAEKKLEMEISERQRLVKSLHDAINQSLFSAGLIAEVLPRLWEKDQAAARRSLEDLRRLTFGALAETKVLFVENNPSFLMETELGDLLILLGNALSGRMNIPVQVQVEARLTISPKFKDSIYRLCKEYLDNIAHESRASEVDIDTKNDDEYGEIHIIDNGNSPENKEDADNSRSSLKVLVRETKEKGAEVLFLPRKDQWNELVIRIKNNQQDLESNGKNPTH